MIPGLSSAQYLQFLSILQPSSAGPTSHSHLAGVSFFSCSLQSSREFFDQSTWIIDTGASDHISYNRSLFENFRQLTSSTKIRLPTDQIITVVHVSSAKLSMTSQFMMCSMFHHLDSTYYMYIV